MSPLPKLDGGAPLASAARRDEGAEDGAAAQCGSAADGALAQEGHPGVARDRVGGLADGAVGVHGFEIDMSHADCSLVWESGRSRTQFCGIGRSAGSHCYVR